VSTSASFSLIIIRGTLSSYDHFSVSLLLCLLLVKPGNLLCTNQRLSLFDFGSAADLDPSPAPPGVGSLFTGGNRRVGYDEGFAAISPVYCAPEIFVKVNENPLSFDVFSAGLIMSQLLFNLLDERSESNHVSYICDV
jgi:hypothetical protein